MTDSAAERAAWQSCAIVEVTKQTPGIKSFFLRLSAPFSYKAGQHVDVRLTAPNGYSAMRSYSIASSPNSSGILELAVERLADGEVSPFFHDVARVGDEIELRGPLGGHFIWPDEPRMPILLIGAGSGLVPLMSMIRHRRTSGQQVPIALLLSARTWHDVLFRAELLMMQESLPNFVLSLTLTREAPMRKTDFGRRIDAAMVVEVVNRLPELPGHVFICGSNAFVEVAADGALAAGLGGASIKTERYGT